MTNSWQSLATSLENEVSLKGFLYQDGSGNWFLAKEPGIKTCCLSNQKHKVFLVGFEPPLKNSSAITIRGLLKHSEAEGLMLEGLSIDTTRTPFPSFTLLIVFAAILLLWLLRKSYHSRDSSSLKR